MIHPLILIAVISFGMALLAVHLYATGMLFLVMALILLAR